MPVLCGQITHCLGSLITLSLVSMKSMNDVSAIRGKRIMDLFLPETDCIVISYLRTGYIL